MADLTGAVAVVDRSLPPRERYIHLTEAAFDGGAGEGDFINGSGSDDIAVSDFLGYKGTSIELYFTEATAASGDTYTITLLVNHTITRYRTNTTTYKNPLGMPIAQLDTPATFTNQSTPINIIAQAGQIVTWNETFPNGIESLRIDGSGGGTGALGNLRLTIR